MAGKEAGLFDWVPRPDFSSTEMAWLFFAKKLHLILFLPLIRGLPTEGVEFQRDEIFSVVAYIGTIVLPQDVRHGQSAPGSQRAGIEDEEFEKNSPSVREIYQQR